MKVIRTIKVWTNGFDKVNTLIEDFLVLYEFFEAKEATEKEVDQLFAEVIEKEVQISIPDAQLV